jgi:hypothetical protein
VHRDVLSFDVLQDSVVRRRLAPFIVLGLQTIDGHNNLKTTQTDPLGRDGPYSAGYDLGVDTHSRQPRENFVELAETNQWFASDDRNMEGPVRFDEREEARHELGALEIADLPQRDVTTEMFISVGVTAGAFKGTFAGNLY